MATGGYEPDTRRTCRICLHPFKGRQPKILKCFHTFCSECLVQLVERQTTSLQVQDSTQGAEDAGQKDLPVTFTCPTCDTCIPLPPGGVSHLQTNIYVDEDGDEDDPQPVLCDLCEGKRKAQFQCRKCLACFCRDCYQFPDNVCKPSFLRAMTDRAGSTGTTPAVKESPQLVQVMEEVPKTAAVTADQQPPVSFSPTQTPSDLTVGLPASIPIRTGDLTAQLEDLSARSTQSEKVTAGLQAQISLLCRDMVALQDHNARMSADVTATHKEMASLRDDLTSQRRELNTLHTAHKKLQSEHTKLQSDHDTLQSDHDKLQSDHDKLQSDHRKNQSDHGKLQSDHNKLQSDHDKLKLDHSKLESDHDKLQTDHDKLQSDHDKLQSDHDKLQSDHDKLQSDNDKLQTVHDKLQSDHDKLQSDHDKLQSDHVKLQSDHDQLGADHRQLQSDQDQLQRDQQKVGADVHQVQADHRQVMKDQDTVRSEVTTLRTDLGHIQLLVQKDTSAIATLEAQLTRLNVHVGFHAKLTAIVTATQPQTIICDGVITNVGGGYNSQTGVFTAPVSGTYCFMAASTPYSDDVKDTAALFIVMEDQKVCYLWACGRGRTTGQCAVQVQAGQTVRLRSYHGQGKEHRFCGGWGTTFTGMLLQPEL